MVIAGVTLLAGGAVGFFTGIRGPFQLGKEIACFRVNCRHSDYATRSLPTLPGPGQGLDCCLAWLLYEGMATTKQVRQRWAGACAVGLLCLGSVLMALVSDDSSAASRIILVVLALGIAGFGITYLIRGRQKGSPVIFAPVRWQVGLVSIMGGVGVILILWGLMEDPRNLTSFAYVPALIATWIGAMFRSEAAVETERSITDV